MDELLQLVKSLTDSLDAVIKAQTQQAKTISELAKLCDAKEVSKATATRVKDLAENQEVMAKVMNLHINAMKQQAAMVLSKQLVVAMPSELQEQTSPPLTGFPQFGRLPVEIRNIIWKMALPGRRVIEKIEGELPRRFRSPVIRAVCKEAWEVTNENGSFVFGLELNPAGGTWFNPKKDVLILDNPAGYPLGSFEDCRPDIIAIDLRYFEKPTDFIRVLTCALDAHCREVIVLFRSTPNLKYKKGTAPKLFSLDPNEAIWSAYAPDRPDDLDLDFDITWKEFKSTMQYHWDDEIRQSK
ncbi:hypothetical protein BDP81DRAFT_449477 [Colletotrichum phormii]|uniref:2EXR domain-containing protein n=1 Tax=Colletotrichum phormii TaxID=359342 RepID=A0AAI9ZQQ9_9PEZI|nr:uncharacterized protein BDP81DRAFT_449477 [Colletotrichum phormii]KAK1636439.1 hypothetical protein BDP81DRAFT_449477 [Colletotrichum phormii]